jgi:hypothetical protein
LAALADKSHTRVSLQKLGISLEEFTHGRKPRTGIVRNAVKSPYKEVTVVGVFRIAGLGGNVNLANLTITVG